MITNHKSFPNKSTRCAGEIKKYIIIFWQKTLAKPKKRSLSTPGHKPYSINPCLVKRKASPKQESWRITMFTSGVWKMNLINK